MTAVRASLAGLPSGAGGVEALAGSRNDEPALIAADRVADCQG